jgi:predicted nucleic acid-binding protein
VREAWRFVAVLLASPGLEVLVPTDRHAEVASQVFDEVPHVSGNLVHDAHTAVLMREHGIRRIFTRDTDFHRFPFLDPLDPLSRSPGRTRSVDPSTSGASSNKAVSPSRR